MTPYKKMGQTTNSCPSTAWLPLRFNCPETDVHKGLHREGRSQRCHCETCRVRWDMGHDISSVQLERMNNDKQCLALELRIKAHHMAGLKSLHWGSTVLWISSPWPSHQTIFLNRLSLSSLATKILLILLRAYHCSWSIDVDQWFTSMPSRLFNHRKNLAGEH